jgi:hypothetical protein
MDVDGGIDKVYTQSIGKSAASCRWCATQSISKRRSVFTVGPEKAEGISDGRYEQT